MLVSLCNYSPFEHTEITMCIGERLDITSEYVVGAILCFTLVSVPADAVSQYGCLFSFNSDGDFMMVRSATTGVESYIPTDYTARLTHR